MLPIAGRPIIDYLLERMRAAPSAELRIVTRPDKQDVIEHARAVGAEVVLGEPRTVSESLRLGLAGLEDPEDVALVGFPDSLWQPPNGYARLVAALDEDHDVALGVFHSPEPERSDAVELDEGDRVTAVHVKDPKPVSRRIWGCAAARASALGGLAEHDEPGHLFNVLAKSGRVRGVAFPGEFTDIGTKASLIRAQTLYSGGT